MPAFEPPADRAPRVSLDALIVSHEQTLENTYELVLHAPPIACGARPGQFVELLFGEGYEPLLRRPFSICRADRDAGTFLVLYRAHGSFTSGLVQKRPGDRISVIGPLGRPFRWSPDPALRHILIAGGIGAPPLCFLAAEMCADGGASGNSVRSVVVLNAARTVNHLICMEAFGCLPLDLMTVTDDGSHGRRGVAPRLLASLLDEPGGLVNVSIYACGPMPMLRAVGEVANARGLPCQLSIETSMPCGTGLCRGCAVAVRDPSAEKGIKYVRACIDGPVFEAQELSWK